MIWLDESTKFGQRVMGQLAGEHIIWLTTVRADGMPQTSPVWFWWDGASFLIYSQSGKPKVRNIAQNPNVTLHFNSDFAGHEVTVFTGTAVSDPAAPAPNQHPDYLEKYREGIQTINMTPDSFATVYTQPIRVTPTQLRGH